MFARLAIIFLLTGFGHLLSIITLKYTAAKIDSGTFRDIAQIDSHVQLILSIIALGLQTSAIRDIATSPDWKENYKNTQSARISLSIILLSFVFFAINDKNYIIYLIAPILAINSDYVLYARGLPVFGAFIAFIRLSIPLIVLLLFSFYIKLYVFEAYLTSLFIVYLTSNVFINIYLNVQQIVKPRAKDLLMYLKSLPMGVITVGFYFLGLGMIIIADFFYSNSEIATVFVLIKFYVIYKGVLRIIHQSFIKEMQDDYNGLKIDKLSIILGLILLGSTLLFPQTFTTLFFGEKYLNDIHLIRIIGISAIIYSLFLSTATKAMLLKKDKIYLIIIITSVFSSITLLILSHLFYHEKKWILLSILSGEIILSVGLAMAFLNTELIIKRILFLLKISCILLIPFGLVTIFNDNISIYVLSFSLFSIFSVLLSLKEIKIK